MMNDRKAAYASMLAQADEEDGADDGDDYAPPSPPYDSQVPSEEGTESEVSLRVHNDLELKWRHKVQAAMQLASGSARSEETCRVLQQMWTALFGDEPPWYSFLCGDPGCPGVACMGSHRKRPHSAISREPSTSSTFPLTQPSPPLPSISDTSSSSSSVSSSVATSNKTTTTTTFAEVLRTATAVPATAPPVPLLPWTFCNCLHQGKVHKVPEACHEYSQARLIYVD